MLQAPPRRAYDRPAGRPDADACSIRARGSGAGTSHLHRHPHGGRRHSEAAPGHGHPAADASPTRRGLGAAHGLGFEHRRDDLDVVPRGIPRTLGPVRLRRGRRPPVGEPFAGRRAGAAGARDTFRARTSGDVRVRVGRRRNREVSVLAFRAGAGRTTICGWWGKSPVGPVQAFDDLTGGGAGLRIFGQSPGDQVVERVRHDGQVGLVQKRSIDHCAKSVLAEGRPAGRRVGDRRRPGEHVCLAGDLALVQDLGRHVGGTADRTGGPGRGGIEQSGDAEIDDSWTVGTQEHVVRLEISMHDSGAADPVERGRQRARQRQQVRRL
jgi:hypothetical protein